MRLQVDIWIVMAYEVSLANLLKMHAEEVFGYQDYESALQSLFI